MCTKIDSCEGVLYAELRTLEKTLEYTTGSVRVFTMSRIRQIAILIESITGTRVYPSEELFWEE